MLNDIGRDEDPAQLERKNPDPTLNRNEEKKMLDPHPCLYLLTFVVQNY